MEINFNRKINLSVDDIKNLIIRYYHHSHELSGIFDIDFMFLEKNGSCYLTGASVKISENTKESS